MPNGSPRIYIFNPGRGSPQGPPGDFSRLKLIIIVIIALFLFPYVLSGPGRFFADILDYAILIPIILISLSFHEFSHALMADFLGDPTPRRQGRLSLNPMRHLDFVGTLMIMVARFGWAKPVEVDPSNFRVPQRAMLSVALAGPGANIILALVGALLFRGALETGLVTRDFSPTLFAAILKKGLILHIWINLGLAIFNLLPLPPLDGSRVLSYYLPSRYRVQYRQFEEMAPMILLLLFVFGVFGHILSPLVERSFRLLLTLVGVT